MSLDLPGFGNPVQDAQAAFRAVLDATARPGSVRRVGAGLTPPAPLMAATAAVLLALVDADAPVWTAPGFSPAHDWLAFHCGARLASDQRSARFLLVDGWPDLADVDCGSDEAPQDGATLLLQVTAFGTGRRLRLEGPGLRTHATLAVEGLPDGFATAWAANHSLRPRGVDLILCAGEALAALPRSVAVTEA